MKLKKYDASNCIAQRGRSNKSYLRINCKSGLISFSRAFCTNAQLLDESKDYRIVFYNDLEKPENWYIALNLSDDTAFLLKMYKNSVFAIQNTVLAKTIKESLKTDLNSFKMMISTEKENGYFPIITKSIRP